MLPPDVIQVSVDQRARGIAWVPQNKSEARRRAVPSNLTMTSAVGAGLWLWARCPTIMTVSRSNMGTTSLTRADIPGLSRFSDHQFRCEPAEPVIRLAQNPSQP